MKYRTYILKINCFYSFLCIQILQLYNFLFVLNLYLLVRLSIIVDE